MLDVRPLVRGPRFGYGSRVTIPCRTQSEVTKDDGTTEWVYCMKVTSKDGPTALDWPICADCYEAVRS